MGCVPNFMKCNKIPHEGNMPKGRETIEFAAFLRYSLTNKITVTRSPAEVGCPRSKFIIILPRRGR